MDEEFQQPAFPTLTYEAGGLDDGMTLRDYFAAKAMQAYIQDPNSGPMPDVADDAYRMAEYMMERRNAGR